MWRLRCDWVCHTVFSFFHGLHWKLNRITSLYQMEVVWINWVNAWAACEWSLTRHEVSDFNNFAVRKLKKRQNQNVELPYVAVVFVVTSCSLVYGSECFGGISAFTFYVEDGVSKLLRNVRAHSPDYISATPHNPKYKFCYFWAPMILRVGRKDKLGLFTLRCLKKLTFV
jgi:hypothetical protein